VKKHQSVLAFEKALGSLSGLYILIVPSEFERRALIEKVVAAVGETAMRLEGSIEQLIEQLTTRSLFEMRHLIIYDGFDKLKSDELRILSDYLEHPCEFSRLILAAASAKPLSALSQKAKQGSLILDLSEEKPWERQRRLEEQLIASARGENKSLAPEVATHLVHMIGPDAALLDAELNKLICYVGERKEITLADVREIGSIDRSFSGWQLSEGIVWSGKMLSADLPPDPAFFFSLIGQVRYQLEIGLQLSALLESGSKEIAARFPQLKSRTLDHYIKVAKARSLHYFRDGLVALFEIENLCKSGFRQTPLLWNMLCAKLQISASATES
jgi:DNA polymerase III subunit delta